MRGTRKSPCSDRNDNSSHANTEQKKDVREEPGVQENVKEHVACVHMTSYSARRPDTSQQLQVAVIAR